jgi:hypothetical protein
LKIPGINASQKFDYLINWYAYLDDNQWLKDWSININDGPKTFVILRPGADANGFTARVRDFLHSYYKEQRSGFHIELGIQRFDEMYLHSHFKNGQVDGGRIEYVKLFSIIALFILVIACVNFMNLTTATFHEKSKGDRHTKGGRPPPPNTAIKPPQGGPDVGTCENFGLAKLWETLDIEGNHQFSAPPVGYGPTWGVASAELTALMPFDSSSEDILLAAPPRLVPGLRVRCWRHIFFGSIPSQSVWDLLGELH